MFDQDPNDVPPDREEYEAYLLADSIADLARNKTNVLTIPRHLWPEHYKTAVFTSQVQTWFNEWVAHAIENGLLTSHAEPYASPCPSAEGLHKPTNRNRGDDSRPRIDTMAAPSGFGRFASKAPAPATPAAPVAAAPAPRPAPVAAAPAPRPAPVAAAPAPRPAPVAAAPAPRPAPVAAAPAPRPAPVAAAPAEPEVLQVETEVETAPADAPQTRALSLGALKVNALAMIAQEPATTFTEPFPTIQLKGGNAGGNVIPSKPTSTNWPEIATQLPQGKQAFKGVLMGARSFAIAWPVTFDDRKDGDRPSLSGAIPLTDGDATGLLLQGSDNYQFCPREAKASKWSVPAGGPGHLRPVFQLLVWSSTLGEPVVIESCGLLATYRKMAGQVAQFIDADSGELRPVPCSFAPVTEPWYDGNVYHYFQGSWWVQDAAAEAAWNAFHAWAQDVQENRPDVIEAVMAWSNGTDSPLAAADMARLRRAAGMVNPRGRRKAATT
jgi:hypothetical protein